MLKSKHRICLLGILISLLIPFRGTACTTPVFRYALERWSSSPYIVEIIHEKPFDEEQQGTLDLLESAVRKGANLKVVKTAIDPDSPGSSKIAREDLPLVRLFYPVEQNNRKLIWKGSLTPDPIRKIIDSPVRREIVERIARGDASVWILLTGGGAEEEDLTGALLQQQLTRLSKELTLPEAATDSNGKPPDLPAGKREVRFSLITLRRDDPQEEIFVRILKNSEPDLSFYQEAIAFPVFGRGRAMYALVGKGIDARNIQTACSAIIGWCSCTIKESNPGHDLLMAADWDRVMGETSWIAREEMPEITGFAGFFKDSNGKKRKQESPEKIAGRAAAARPPVAPEATPAPPVRQQVSRSVSLPPSDPSVAGRGASLLSGSDNRSLSRNLLFTLGLILVSVLGVAYLLRTKEK